jgi:hypothetical protein
MVQHPAMITGKRRVKKSEAPKAGLALVEGIEVELDF